MSKFRTSEINAQVYVGDTKPAPDTNIPEAYIGRLYYAKDVGITFRLVDDTPNANVWVSLETPSMVISKSYNPTFNDVPDGSIWNDTHRYDAQSEKWLVIKSSSVPTPTMDENAGYDIGHKIVVGSNVYRLWDNKAGKAIWARLDNKEPNTNTSCSPTKYIGYGSTLYRCYGNGNWYNYDTNTLVCKDDPNTINPLPKNATIVKGNEKWHTDSNGNLKVDVFSRVPTTADDGTAGYKVGDIWTVTPSGDRYRCLDATDGKAVWAKIYDRDPTKYDDLDKGFEVGDGWFNETNNHAFTCLSNSNNNAVWKDNNEIGTLVKMPRDPNRNDDITFKFHPRDLWKNTSTGEVFKCKSNADGNAVWVKIKANSKPTKYYDKGLGYEIGDTIDVNNIKFICEDNADNNAKWLATAYRNPTKYDDVNSNPPFSVGDKFKNLETGELFICDSNSNNNARWRSLTVIEATETRKGIAEISTQSETDAGIDDTRIVTPKKLKTYVNNPSHLPIATETRKGIAEISTQSETDAGIDDTRIVTPKKLKTLLDNRDKGMLKIDNPDESICFTITGKAKYTIANDGTTFCKGSSEYESLFGINADIVHNKHNFAPDRTRILLNGNDANIAISVSSSSGDKLASIKWEKSDGTTGVLQQRSANGSARNAWLSVDGDTIEWVELYDIQGQDSDTAAAVTLYGVDIIKQVEVE